MADDFILDTDDLQRRMDGALGALRTEFASLRTGRASASMLEPIMIVFLGIVIGFILVAMYQPIFLMGSAV